jgi:hypothetical protein
MEPMVMELVCRRATTLWGRRYKPGDVIDVAAKESTEEECGGDVFDWLRHSGL